MNKQLLIQGALYVLIGALTPVMALLSSESTLDRRQTITAIIAGVVAGATALKAFLSTTFADSPQSDTPGRTLRLQRKEKR